MFWCDFILREWFLRVLPIFAGSQVPRPAGGLPRVAQGGTCPHCGQEYANQSSLKYHVRLVHSEMTDRACCHLCPKSYRTRESFKLKQHMKDAHNVHYWQRLIVCQLDDCTVFSPEMRDRRDRSAILSFFFCRWGKDLELCCRLVV